jgi:hypothetical protein
LNTARTGLRTIHSNISAAGTAGLECQSSGLTFRFLNSIR